MSNIKVTGIGGGTGLSTLFRGLRNENIDISGIISVTDDGGSSGRLREGYGILPPGDFRNCLVALSDAEPLLKKLFQHRFDGNDPLSGHSFGNLFILAMEKITGNFEEALSLTVACSTFSDFTLLNGSSPQAVKTKLIANK